MKTKKLVIIGGGYAGVMAAFRARRLAKGKIDITLISERDFFVERIRLHQFGFGDSKIEHGFKEMLHRSSIHFRKGMVREIDPKTMLVHLDQNTIHADAIIGAPGSEVKTRIPIEEGQLIPLNYDGMMALKNNRKFTRVTVIGGGITGIEAATEAAHFGHRVSLICRTALADSLSENAQERIKKHLRRVGIELIENAEVLSVDAKGR